MKFVFYFQVISHITWVTDFDCLAIHTYENVSSTFIFYQRFFPFIKRLCLISKNESDKLNLLINANNAN